MGDDGKAFVEPITNFGDKRGAWGHTPPHETVRRATPNGFARRLIPALNGWVPYFAGGASAGALGGTPITLTPAPRAASIAKITS